MLGRGVDGVLVGRRKPVTNDAAAADTRKRRKKRVRACSRTCWNKARCGMFVRISATARDWGKPRCDALAVLGREGLDELALRHAAALFAEDARDPPRARARAAGPPRSAPVPVRSRLTCCSRDHRDTVRMRSLTQRQVNASSATAPLFVWS